LDLLQSSLLRFMPRVPVLAARDPTGEGALEGADARGARDPKEEGALEGPDARGARDPVGARGASSSLLPKSLSKRSSCPVPKYSSVSG
jgi:hypothetical protein